MSEYQPEHRGDISEAPESRTFLSNVSYDRLKWVAQVALPALALFYIALSPLWGLPKQEEVAGTIVALDLLLGTLLGVSNQRYKNSDARFDGQIVVSPNNEGNSNLNVSLDPQAVAHKKEVVVKVDRV